MHFCGPFQLRHLPILRPNLSTSHLIPVSEDDRSEEDKSEEAGTPAVQRNKGEIWCQSCNDPNCSLCCLALHDNQSAETEKIAFTSSVLLLLYFCTGDLGQCIV